MLSIPRTTAAHVFLLAASFTIGSLSISGASAAEASYPGIGQAQHLHGRAHTSATALSQRAVTRFGTTTPAKRGQSLKSAVARQRSRFGPLGVVRLFYGGFPAPWRVIIPAVHRSPVSVSFKLSPARVLSGRYDNALRTWFRSAPRHQRTFWTYFHEPEDNIKTGQFSAAKYRAAWNHIGSIARAAHAATGANLEATLVLMCWTANPHSRRSWKSYYAAATVRVVGWDCYNSGARKGRYKSPSAMLSDAIRVTTKARLSWAVTELGSTIARHDNGVRRARWLTQTSAFASQHHALFVAYFDSDVGVNYRLNDPASIRAWAARTPG